MPTRSIAAVYTESEPHLLDHIAPLAHLLQIPLIVSQECDTELIQRYYPHVTLECGEPIELRLQEMAERFDALICCKYWKPQLKTIFSKLYGKQMDLIFCPHGQSDKGFASPLLAPYAEQDMVLLYGDLLIDMLKALHIWPHIQRFAIIGDYRRRHYEMHRSFYDLLADEQIFSKLPQNHPTLLYAPTWVDADSASSFFDWSAKIASELPNDWNLIVKVHPLLEQRNPSHYYSTARHFENRRNALLVSSFPPVHAILQRADAYLGDFSSVGYDFLYQGRPMFFIRNEALPAGRLQECGHYLNPHQPIFPQIEQWSKPGTQANMKNKQEALYRYAYTERDSKIGFGQRESFRVAQNRFLNHVRYITHRSMREEQKQR